MSVRSRVLHARKRTVAIVAAVSVSGLAIAGGVVAESSADAPDKTVSSPADTAAAVADLQASADASASAAAAQQAAAAKAAADRAAAAKAAALKAAAQKAAAAKAAAARAAAQKAAEERVAAARAAEQRAAAAKAAARAAAERQAASRSESRSALSGSPQQIAAQIVPADQLASFSAIISHESGWNVHAENPSSGAYGLGQALPGSKMASAGSDWQDSAATQIRWALGYMNSRYGSPNAAWAFWQANSWY
ncbi:aggregation-promoting factor C-terminal-like domain-containing protein [Streptacidiphilus cavernicola]|uniref:Lytic transglycosylase domain-containing protein n=1 Tax=Streptacidiphilus cavernicola TaxID=3342716 RepID=A0ABV6VYU8_9ACTN